jgi:hypothetical protein
MHCVREYAIWHIRVAAAITSAYKVHLVPAWDFSLYSQQTVAGWLAGARRIDVSLVSLHNFTRTQCAVISSTTQYSLGYELTYMCSMPSRFVQTDVTKLFAMFSARL